jgi:hypothetical protein
MLLFVYVQLKRAHEELNKRIFEHDQCMSEGKIDKKEITLQVRKLGRFRERKVTRTLSYLHLGDTFRFGYF